MYNERDTNYCAAFCNTNINILCTVLVCLLEQRTKYIEYRGGKTIISGRRCFSSIR